MMSKNSIAATRCRLVALAGLLSIVAAGCSNSSTSPTNGTGGNTAAIVTIAINGGVYSPNPLTIRVGQSVNWHNEDSISHTATDPGVFDIGSIFPGSAASVNGDGVPFNTVGTFNFHCTIHPNETGSIIVTP